MKQLWILIIAVCCTLPVLGQHQNSDSTRPGTQRKDSGRAGRSVPGKKEAVTTNSQQQNKTKSQIQQQKKDTNKAIRTQNEAQAKAAKIDSGDKKSPKPDRQLSAADTIKGARKATGVVAAAANNNKGPEDSTALTPEQIEARQLALEQLQIKAHADSVYAANKSQILSGLSTAALSITNNRTPDYRIYFPDYFSGKSVNGQNNDAIVRLHAYHNKDLLFYAILGITFLLALTKMIFPRYFNQVFWFFLHPNDRKNNVSDQIRGQNVLPSLLLNLFFVLTGGLFLTQIIRPNLPGANFWTSWAILSLLLASVYLVKYLVILVSGWLFGAPVAATIYNQIVFSINKIIGLVLLPATLLICYGATDSLGQVFNTILVIIVILLIYRYIASFLLIKGKLKVSAFHFILYLCAVEIIPLLLVYKVLLTNLEWFV